MARIFRSTGRAKGAKAMKEKLILRELCGLRAKFIFAIICVIGGRSPASPVKKLSTRCGNGRILPGESGLDRLERIGNPRKESGKA
jgi:hypothetical protein